MLARLAEEPADVDDLLELDSATNDRLLEIIVKLFHRGEVNKIRLANAAIARFEALDLDEPA